MVKLGLGCIGIGRSWGFRGSTVPSESDVFKFLDKAYELGIRFFDTSPAYGHSEERLGKWIKYLTDTQRRQITISTKFGEFWDFNTQKSFRKYDSKNLIKSLNTSFKLLGKIDILQVHGFTKQVYEDNLKDINIAFDFAKAKGVGQFGLSLSDTTVFEKAIGLPYKIIQIPHNILIPNNSDLIKKANSLGKFLIINRPFAMGELVYNSVGISKTDAFKFILNDLSNGIILTGTKSVEHLKENLDSFKEVNISK